MAIRRETIRVRTLKVIELVQKGTALADQTKDTELKDRCTSLLSAVMAHGVSNATVTIRKEPHERQMDYINNAISGVTQ